MGNKPTGENTVTRRFNLNPTRRRQLGQAAVFVYVFLAVLIVGMSSLYKAGKFTSDKMEMQNAADAAAYSVSVIEARDLNFASYMNRAIVANEVAIGQLVGLASFAFHWRSFHDYLSLYSTPLKAPPITPLGTAFEAMAKGFKISGDIFIKILKPLANYGTTITHNINKVYGYSQFGYHLASTFYAMGSLDKMLGQNAPNGARLSEYGFLSLIGHLATYGAMPGLPGEKFTRSYNPAKKGALADLQTDIAGETDIGGYGRLAALIHDSSDPFVKGRGWIFDFFKEMNKLIPFPSFLYSERNGQGWLGPNIGPVTIPLGFADVRWKLWLQVHIDLARVGASELRAVQPAKVTGGTKGKKKKTISGQSFSWSSADTTGLNFGIDGGFWIKARLCLPLVACTSWQDIAGGQLSIVNEKLKAIANVFGKKFTLLNTPFPSGVPFGAGFAQAGTMKGSGKKKIDNFLTANKKHMGLENLKRPLRGPLPPDAYGKAANSLLAWSIPIPPGVYFQAGMPERKVNQKYAGLPRYIDTANNTPLHGSGGPNLVVGVVMSETDFDLSNPQPGQPASAEIEPVGRFQITERMATNKIHAIAKSEVYFKRPSDLSYFLRVDAQEEYGSAFNPYWNARLIETSHADRAAALNLEQNVDMEGTGKPYDLSSLLGPALNLLGL